MRGALWCAVLWLPLAAACSAGSDRVGAVAQAQSCMTCHNGSQHDDYSGPGIEDPHPFGAAKGLLCTDCHGGNPAGEGVADSHVPPPPQIGGREQWEVDRFAYFNRLTLTGLDKLPDYEVEGTSYTALDYLQFVNPGDLRVTEAGRGCGACHAAHSRSVARSPLATSTGILGGAAFAIGAENAVPENAGLYEDTASDLAFRAIEDPSFGSTPPRPGAVPRLIEHPVNSVFGQEGGSNLYRSDLYRAADLADDRHPDNRVVTGSPLANLYHETVAFTCGDCHLGSAGANNRFGDFRSSGCSACHMPKSLDGRSRSGDPNVPRLEPANPDQIRTPELPHLRRHRIHAVMKELENGHDVPGIDDQTCAGCHQGSNRTVMQYWGIRLDQNTDVRRGVQYPANPVSYLDTRHDLRLFDPAVGNQTFNGRNRHQYLAFEDYDGDGRDDTPEDVHHEAGMGCIDCHGTHDLHGDVAGGNPIVSRMEQATAIRCESCHGTSEAYAPTALGTDHLGVQRQLALDARGNVLRNVWRDADGHYYLRSRLTGAQHYVRQTLDVVVDNARQHPFTQEPLYSAAASYAMGRADGDPATGIGPLQHGMAPNGFKHGDSMSCVSCHASWTNSCVGCHLGGEYSTNPNNFSNITGQRIVFRQANADFTYQTPVPFQLGVGPRGKIEPISPNTLVFFQYRDRHGERSQVFSFSDRRGAGNDPADAPHPALSHNVIMPHSIRGKVGPTKEGPRSCAACHLTQEGIADFQSEYDSFRAALANRDFGALDFPLLAEHIGKNTGNQKNSPLWVHMVAGLGSGLFLFDEHGCPVNPLDANADRFGCEGESPASKYDPARVALNLDRIVEETGVSNASNNHPLESPAAGAGLREGALDPGLAGPLGWHLLRKLTDPVNGIVLDSWYDADGLPRGGVADFVGDE